MVRTYPAGLDLRGRLVVVVGLGAVGRRRLGGLLAAGARARGVEPDAGARGLAAREFGGFLEGAGGSPGGGVLRLAAEGYREEHLDEGWEAGSGSGSAEGGWGCRPALVVAAGPGDLNARVARDARARGIWVNRADDASGGDVWIPAVAREGPLTAAVWTGGAGAALAGALRDRVREVLRVWAPWGSALAELREALRVSGLGSSDRAALARAWASSEFLERAARARSAEDWEGLRAEARAMLEARSGGGVGGVPGSGGGEPLGDSAGNPS